MADSGSYGIADFAEKGAEVDCLPFVGAGGSAAGLSRFPGECFQSDSQRGDRPAGSAFFGAACHRQRHQAGG